MLINKYLYIYIYRLQLYSIPKCLYLIKYFEILNTCMPT